jgi:hypothetical protein
MLREMKNSAAVEIGLRNGHIVYGRCQGIVSDETLGSFFVVLDPNGATVFTSIDRDNIAYIKLVPADPELEMALGQQQPRQRENAMDDDSEPPPRRVDVEPLILNGPPPSRVGGNRLEEVKERFRHNTTFSSNQRPAFRPRIQIGDEEKE